MTVGLLLNTSLPKAVWESYGKSWRKKIAEDFLTINFLTCRNVAAKLIGGNLENWEITLENEVMVCKIVIKFYELSRELEKIEIYYKQKAVTAGLKALALSVKAFAVKNIKMYDLTSYVQEILTVVNRK